MGRRPVAGCPGGTLGCIGRGPGAGVGLRILFRRVMEGGTRDEGRGKREAGGGTGKKERGRRNGQGVSLPSSRFPHPASPFPLYRFPPPASRFPLNRSSL